MKAVPTRALTLDERFWRSVSKQEGDGCWLWMGSRDRDGYGRFHLSPNHLIRAHRYGYRLAHGEPPEGAHILHHCDTPRCVRPDHLFLGTHQDNMKDRNSKGHQPLGSRNGRAKLTEVEVKCIRLLLDDGKLSYREIADRFMIGDAVISDIARRKTWRHVA